MQINSSNAPHTVKLMILRSIKWIATDFVTVLSYAKRVIDGGLSAGTKSEQHSLLKI